MYQVVVGLKASALRSVLIVLIFFNLGLDFRRNLRPGQFKLNVFFLIPANTSDAIANRTVNALLVALKAIEKRDILHDIGVDWHVADIQSSSSLTAKKFYELWADRSETPHVIFGGYSEKLCTLLAILSHSLNMPFLAIGCKANNERNHVLLPTFLSFDYDPASVLPVVIALMETYNWKRLAILTTSDTTFFEVGLSAKMKIEEKKWKAIFIQTTMDMVPEGFTSPEADAEIKLLLENVKKQARS